ncbi:PREDICTED: mitochondrial import receptor subunit TOM6 homolog [Chaetura pelagica]|uniref:mitochondrial import receptor subunit TOM6 homolog n=1 Tax=Chaetura pelagica TaxID=8897 RepID=UPI000523A6B6|nr:PREDICTED: mitochondrial import receptor subunit TOM6 homolog [Chaetura pelagica]
MSYPVPPTNKVCSILDCLMWNHVWASSRNLLVNLGLFAAGVWVARNLTDIDLMAPQPVP